MHLLGRRGARTLLHPCFERALHAAPQGHAAQAAQAAHAFAAPDFPSSSQATIVQDNARSRPATQRAACIGEEGAPDPKRHRGPSSEVDSGVVCIIGASNEAAMSLQHCLMARAMALRPPDPQQDVAMLEGEHGVTPRQDEARLGQQVADLQALGAIVSIFARVACKPTGQAVGGGGGAELPVPTALLDKALAWLRALVVMARRDGAAQAARSSEAASSGEAGAGGGVEGSSMESLMHAGLDLVEVVTALDAQSLGPELVDTAARLASLPWEVPSAGAQRLEPAGAQGAARHSVALRCQAVRVLGVLPPAVALPTLKRAMAAALVALQSATEATRHGGGGGEVRVAVAALEVLPLLLSRLGRGDSTEFAEFGGSGRELYQMASCLLAQLQLAPSTGASATEGSAAASVLQLCTPLATTIGLLVCLQAGTCAPRAPQGGSQSHGGMPRHALRGSGDHEMASRPQRETSGDAGCVSHTRTALRCSVCEPTAEAETGGAAAAVAGESGGNGWMQAWLPMLWKVQAALPPTHVAQRVALLRAMARLAQHAPLAMLARCQQVLRHLVGKLDDEQQDVSAACEQALPLLLGRPQFVRALFPAIGESAALCARTLRAHVIRPMVGQLSTHRERHRSPTADPRAARRMLTMMRVISSLGCHPLYAAAECRAPVFLALCEHLSADELSLEYGTAQQQLSRLAMTCARRTPGAPAGGGSSACLAWLCRDLSPQLHPEWVWWLQERPQLLAHLAAKLLETTEAELLHAAARHALPQLVLHAGLASGHTPPGSQSVADAPHAPARSSSTAARTLSRGTVAGSVLRRLAAVLGYTAGPTQLLLDHMHHILVELFVHHGDATGDANAVVSGGIEFMFEHAEFGDVTFHDLIKMCSGELMQELVLRLGGAADNGAYVQTVRALNTLIPVAMANSSAEADEAGGDGMLSGQALGSSDVNGANMQLCAYIQQNYFMLMQFLREKVRTPRRHATHTLQAATPCMHPGRIPNPHGCRCGTARRASRTPQWVPSTSCSSSSRRAGTPRSSTRGGPSSWSHSRRCSSSKRTASRRCVPCAPSCCCSTWSSWRAGCSSWS